MKYINNFFSYLLNKTPVVILSLSFVAAAAAGIIMIMEIGGAYNDLELKDRLVDVIKLLGVDLSPTTSVQGDGEQLRSAQSQAVLAFKIYCIVALIYLITTLLLTFGKAWTEEAFHDSFYYLGFMFTLVALAVSVYQIAGKPAGERAEQLGPIMVENSVAVASTVVGLLLRNFLAMLSRPSIGRRDRDKFEIVMAQLTKLVDTFPDANDGFAALSHRMETLPEQCNRVAEALSELESQVAAAALSIHSSPVAADEFWNTIESGFKTTREEVDHFQASVGDLNDAILQTTREASGIGASTTTVFSEISERMQSQFEALDEELARAPERVKQLLKDAIDRRVDAAAEGDASQKLREIQQGFASYLQHLQDMNDDLRTATSEMRQTWVDHAGVVEIASHNASESVQKFATAETAVRESLEALARELRAISRSAR